MLWRHLCLVRAWSAAGLLTSSLLGAALATPVRAEPEEPAPAKADAAPVETVSVLDARKAGDLSLDVRGAGQEQVRLTLKNTTERRLRVVLPPGLVASSAAGQRAGGGGGGGFQSMGLGAAGNRPGSFGAFRGAGSTGFRSVAVRDDPADRAVTVPAGQTVELTVPSVCLNFGIRTPGAQDQFELVDVDDYSPDPRVRKALRSLATYGTSQGVAQAVAWRVCNDVPFPLMARKAGKVMNGQEIALAARFVEALDASGSSDLVDPAYLTEGRLFVRVRGEGALAKEAARLSNQIRGLKVLGLPVSELGSDERPAVTAPAVLLDVVLAASQAGETKGRVVVDRADGSGRWVALGKTAFADGSAAPVLDGAGLARALDRAVSSSFVTVKVARRSAGSTTLRVENRLPFTLAGVTLKAGHSAGAPSVPFAAVGLAPARAALVPIEAPTAAVDHVDLNGL